MHIAHKYCEIKQSSKHHQKHTSTNRSLIYLMFIIYDEYSWGQQSKTV